MQKSLNNSSIYSVTPLTWHAARIEVENDTEKGKNIIEKLIGMGILK